MTQNCEHVRKNRAYTPPSPGSPLPHPTLLPHLVILVILVIERYEPLPLVPLPVPVI